ncbi:hypothetical protein BD410DRAFT_167785 [Rickenella mellea]|uniref:Uncharacterized protein n=1 Tax=Rickenella mellea TaxID=50990 RepID=A0A4Y7PJP7_9AGAM|nr:hypothetical protein BD410DRAFT_167785 [Rickenella mellea]
MFMNPFRGPSQPRSRLPYRPPRILTRKQGLDSDSPTSENTSMDSILHWTFHCVFLVPVLVSVWKDARVIPNATPSDFLPGPSLCALAEHKVFTCSNYFPRAKS